MGYPTARSRTEASPDLRRIVREELTALMGPQLERIQALIGERGPSDGARRAVTRGDLTDAGRVNLTAAELAADPVAADFNKVVADLRTLANLLARMGANIGGT